MPLTNRVSTNDCIPSTIPDLCIAYQLHTECGTINDQSIMTGCRSAVHKNTRVCASRHCLTLNAVLFSNSQSS